MDIREVDMTEHYTGSERRAMEKKLLDSERRYKSILDNLQEGYFETNKQGFVTYITPSAYKMFGFNSRDEALGYDTLNIYRDASDRRHFFQHLVNSGKVSEQEMYMKRTDGTDIIISLNAQVLYDDSGNHAGVAGTFRDITEHKRQMSEIIKLYHVVEGSQNALVLAENDGTIIYANQSTLSIAKAPFNITIKNDVIGHNLEEFIVIDGPKTLTEVCRIVQSKGKWFGSATVHCHKGCEGVVPIDVMFSHIKNGNNKTYIVASFYDVSEYRKLEAKVVEQSKSYEDLLSDMNHLVERMNHLNENKQERIATLEREFERSSLELKVGFNISRTKGD